eukprot:14745388-Ditylum_brightwellii.AAC.1
MAVGTTATTIPPAAMATNQMACSSHAQSMGASTPRTSATPSRRSLRRKRLALRAATTTTTVAVNADTTPVHPTTTTKTTTGNNNRNSNSNSNRFEEENSDEDLNHMYDYDEIYHLLSDRLTKYIDSNPPPTKTNPDIIAQPSPEPDTKPAPPANFENTTAETNAPRQANFRLRTVASANPPSPDIDDSDLCTKTIAELTNTEGKHPQILTLLDTGAIGKVGAFIKRDALHNVPHTISKCTDCIQGCYSTAESSKIAIFLVKIPEFCQSKTVTIKAYVEDNANGRHNLILGIKYCSLLGLKFDFTKKLVTWDDISLQMKRR